MPLKGYKQSEEHRKKHSESMIGIKHSKERIRNNSESHKGNKNSRWNGGIKITKSGYINIYSPNHPGRDIDNYVREHRLVIEKILGRFLTKEEIVHHINGNRKDNRPENLILFKNTGEHTQYHEKQKSLNKWLQRCFNISTA